MTEAIKFHDDILEIHPIQMRLRLRGFLFVSLNAVSCFNYQYWFEMDTLPVFVQGLFSNRILKFDYQHD